MGRTTYITGAMFKIWLAEMKMSGRIHYEKDAAIALDVSSFTIRQFKKHGADKRTALACMALARDLRPYGALVATARPEGEREPDRGAQAAEA